MRVIKELTIQNNKIPHMEIGEVGYAYIKGKAYEYSISATTNGTYFVIAFYHEKGYPDSEVEQTKIKVFIDGFSSYAYICKIVDNKWYVAINLNGNYIDWKYFKKKTPSLKRNSVDS